MNKALLVIDYTNDFVADQGKLSCGLPAQAISDNICSLVELFSKNGDFIVVANDYHALEDALHPESALFPPHNIVGTWGRDLYGELGQILGKVPVKQVHFMDKTRYSAFAGTDLELKLRERGINEVHLAGVCTDICILHTAVDAYNKGFKIVVYRGAVQSFDPEGHEWALRHFQKTLGAKII